MLIGPRTPAGLFDSDQSRGRLDQVTVPDSGDYFREVQVRGSITAQKTAQVYVNWSESRIRGARYAADIEAISSFSH